MIEYRCKKCNKLLLKGNFAGNIEILCNRCKELNKLECQEHQS